jgi:hypothetical protein
MYVIYGKFIYKPSFYYSTANEAVNLASSTIWAPKFIKLNEALDAPIVLTDIIDPVIIEPSPPIILAIINELGCISVFLNSRVHDPDGLIWVCN